MCVIMVMANERTLIQRRLAGQKGHLIKYIKILNSCCTKLTE